MAPDPLLHYWLVVVIHHPVTMKAQYWNWPGKPSRNLASPGEGPNKNPYNKMAIHQRAWVPKRKFWSVRA